MEDRIKIENLPSKYQLYINLKPWLTLDQIFVDFFGCYFNLDPKASIALDQGYYQNKYAMIFELLNDDVLVNDRRFFLRFYEYLDFDYARELQEDEFDARVKVWNSDPNNEYERKLEYIQRMSQNLKVALSTL